MFYNEVLILLFSFSEKFGNLDLAFGFDIAKKMNSLGFPCLILSSKRT